MNSWGFLRRRRLRLSSVEDDQPVIKRVGDPEVSFLVVAGAVGAVEFVGFFT